MRKGPSLATPLEIIRHLKLCDLAHANGVRVSDLTSHLGVSQATYYRWRQDFGALTEAQARRLLGLSAADSRVISLTATVNALRKRLTRLQTKNLRLKLKADTLLRQRLNQQQENGTRLLDAVFANRRLRTMQLNIVFFMVRFTQGSIHLETFVADLREHAPREELEKLYALAFDSKQHRRLRALAVVFRLYGVSVPLTATFLNVYRRTVKKYVRRFTASGVAGLLPPRKVPHKRTDATLKRAVFQILHSPPSSHGFNRTTWRRKDIYSVMARNGMRLGINNIDRIIHDAGYRFLKARKVLTSNDPHYRTKVDRIHSILRTLKRSERFFSIDEFGPFAVKKQGGRRLVRPGEYPTVPQFQLSKGCLIITAALELSRNQVTHFYSKGKTTSEMLKLLDLLLEQYRDCTKLYLSWDAASWHASKRFNARIAEVNKSAFRKENGTPAVALAPLPARAQFLNVIESVFSGLATSVIHNSDYASVDEAKAAIDRYFRDRNAEYLKLPRRAGKKIWGEERTASVFDESHNCKNSRFR